MKPFPTRLFLYKLTDFLSLVKPVLYLFLFIVVGLFFDSKFMHSIWSKSQMLANIIMCLSFILLYIKSTLKIRELMLLAVCISIFGEYLFSIELGMYTYSLENVPLYVFFGHAIVYIAVLRFCKNVAVMNKKTIVSSFLLAFVIVYSTFYLIVFGDIFGFILTCLTLFFLIDRPKQRLFFLSMYLVIVFLEQVGTSYACWHWPDTAWGVIPFLKSANPPSGISFFYFGLDLGCLYIYKLRHKAAWARMKNIRILLSLNETF